MNTLEIKNLYVKIDDKIILNNLNLTINSGEIHAIMGPNGTGKSTLSKVIMGDPSYKIESGEIKYNGVLINNLEVDERSRLGLFLGMQMPLEIEGVTNADFLRSARVTRQAEEFKLLPFIKELDRTIEYLNMDKDMVHRDVNRGFSGGERKKNEILQMYMLKPTMVLLDEIDSGLDVDSLKLIGESVTKYHSEYNPGILLITHYQRLLDYIKPDYVHIMVDGHIIKTGDINLVKKIETQGYEKFKNYDKTSTCIVKEILKDE